MYQAFWQGVILNFQCLWSENYKFQVLCRSKDTLLNNKECTVKMHFVLTGLQWMLEHLHDVVPPQKSKIWSLARGKYKKGQTKSTSMFLWDDQSRSGSVIHDHSDQWCIRITEGSSVLWMHQGLSYCVLDHPKRMSQKNREERQENNPTIALSIHLWVSNDGPIIEKEVLQICLTQEIEEHF